MLDWEINPHTAALLDLQAKVQEWQTSGNHIIILTDFNDNVTTAMARTWAAQLGLVEVVTFLHADSTPHQHFNMDQGQLTVSLYHRKCWQMPRAVTLDSAKPLIAIIGQSGSTSTSHSSPQW